jgi:proline iminopeptidase
VKDAERLEDLIPDSRREVFERTGHVAMLERPERFNRLLREFLAEAPAAELAGDSAL